MTQTNNFANAIIIIACIYFLVSTEFTIWQRIGMFIILVFAMSTWEYHFNPKENKELREMKVQAEKSRILNYNAGTSQLITQTRLLNHELKGRGVQ